MTAAVTQPLGGAFGGLAGELVGAAISGQPLTRAGIAQSVTSAAFSVVPVFGAVFGLVNFLTSLGVQRAPDPFRPLRLIDANMRQGIPYWDPRNVAIARDFDRRRLGACEADSFTQGFDFTDPALLAAPASLSLGLPRGATIGQIGGGSAATRVRKQVLSAQEAGFPAVIQAIAPPCDPLSWVWHRQFYGDNAMNAWDWLSKVDFVAGPKDSEPTRIVDFGSANPEKLTLLGPRLATDLEGAVIPTRMSQQLRADLFFRAWSEFGPPTRAAGGAPSRERPPDDQLPISFVADPGGKLPSPIDGMVFVRDAADFWQLPPMFSTEGPNVPRLEAPPAPVSLAPPPQLAPAVPALRIVESTPLADTPAPTAGAPLPVTERGPRAQARRARRGARFTQGARLMPVGFLEALGSGLGSLAQGVAGGLSTGLSQLVAQKIAGGGGGTVVLPGGATTSPMGVGPTFSDFGVGGGGMSITGRRGLVGQPAQAQPAFAGLDLPFVDIQPQGAAATTSPFRTTRSGTQVAKPFQAIKSNGSIEWFIPAGKPTAWSKASIKKRRTCRPR